MSNYSFQYKNVLLTGGSKGIGKAIVKEMIERGAKVTFTDISEPQEIETGASFIQADLRQKDQIEELIRKYKAESNSPDILILNAGRGVNQRIDEGDTGKWEEVIRLNLMSQLHLLRAFIPAMREKGHSDVVFISSVSSFKPFEKGAVYSASKAAIDNVAEVLRLENQDKIRVSVISPGVVDTEFFKENIDGEDDVKSLNMGAILPSEIADAVCYALSRRPEIGINNMVIRPAKQSM